MALQNIVLGCLESVGFPELGKDSVLAKVDTGAYSGSIHCSHIKVVRRGFRGKKVLKYVPFGEPSLATETEQFVQTYVRSANGHKEKRYQVDTIIEVQGKQYPIRIGISDRGQMKRQVLIGRRFIRENNMLVDVRINQDNDDEGEIES